MGLSRPIDNTRAIERRAPIPRRRAPPRPHHPVEPGGHEDRGVGRQHRPQQRRVGERRQRQEHGRDGQDDQAGRRDHGRGALWSRLSRGSLAIARVARVRGVAAGDRHGARAAAATHSRPFGTGVSRRTSATQSSVVVPSISASGCRPMRWRSTAGASAFTSSGTTKSRPGVDGLRPRHGQQRDRRARRGAEDQRAVVARARRRCSVM